MSSSVNRGANRRALNRFRDRSSRASIMMSGGAPHRGIFSELAGSVCQSQLRPGGMRQRSQRSLESELKDEGILYTVKVSVSPPPRMVVIATISLVTAFFDADSYGHVHRPHLTYWACISNSTPRS